MLLNYLTIALRNIIANRLFSAINIIGLAIGLAVCVLIMLFVDYELSYDRHYKDSDRIYRVTRSFTNQNLELATLAPPFKPLLESQFPVIEDITRIFSAIDTPVSRGEVQLSNSGLVLADANVFDFFDMEFVAGDSESALQHTANIVLTQSAAQSLFGDTDPMGETLLIFGQHHAKVSAVIRDLPQNTHLKFDMLASVHVLEQFSPGAMENWGSNSFLTYVRLPEDYDYKILAQKFPDLLTKQFGPSANEWNSLGIQPLQDIHLHSKLAQEMKANGSVTTVYTFSAVALVILLIACINFMNLTTARATQRAKEVGMRKTVGASRFQIALQFIGECIFLTAIAMLLACTLVELSLPWFSSFVERELRFSFFADLKISAVLLTSIVVVGIIAGSYPAFYLSSFRPSQVLKGNAVQGKGSSQVRKILVVCQFATSTVLIIATAVVLMQMHYARTIELGYDGEHNIVITVPQVPGSADNYEALRTELSQHPSISSVTRSSRVPTGRLLDSNYYFREGANTVPENYVGIAEVRIGHNFFEHYAIDLVAGRGPDRAKGDFLTIQATEEAPIGKGLAWLNQSAARKLGYSPQGAIGRVLQSPQNREHSQMINYEVVGVVDDIHFSSLHFEQEPTIFLLEPGWNLFVSVKFDADRINDAVAAIDSSWKKLAPNQAINRVFLDDQFNALYRQEQRQAQVFAMFSALAILVALMGLFGLAVFTTERRTKEIGVRKVMGASVKDIVLLLTREFSLLVILANVLAWPIAYFAMSEWLTRFSYAISLSFWTFLLAGIASLTLAWVTVAAQAGNAAMSRPVLALRYE